MGGGFAVPEHPLAEQLAQHSSPHYSAHLDLLKPQPDFKGPS